ncbi:structure-specific recognition protein 1, partial [Enteropsectra breve]
MDAVAIDGIYIKKTQGILHLEENGVAIRMGENKIEVEKERIRNMVLFRGTKNYVLRIDMGEAVYDVLNIMEQYVQRIRSFASQAYGLSVSNTELENFNTISGNLMFSNNIVYLQGERQILSIPRAEIKRVIEVENDVEMQVEGAEIVFGTTSNITEFIENKKAEEICILNGINCVHPRSKSTLVFFKDYFILKGSSYDHTIFYDAISEMLSLPCDGESSYLVLCLENALIQGQTKYEALVFALGEKDMEIVAADGRLKAEYSGAQSDIVPEIFESLCRMNAKSCTTSLKCAAKVFDGYLYLME